MDVSKVYHGFKLIEKAEIKELNSTALVFEHEKSGAKLIKLENEETNKVFSVSFRTPPENSTGLPHILEHSVLCGSKKFPTKEPFVELIKGSLNTFLNAMTFSDKTMYPVASKNTKDFFNLMDVYMDACFYPNIYKHEEIFMQEGWHYELDNKDEDVTYKGVVYNEMKGAFSSPEGILFRKIQETLFPDTAYGVESGGDPEVIPELSYQEFKDFHAKYYHPSNSYFFLYGDGETEKELEFINTEFLANFDKIEIDSSLKIQKPFTEMNFVDGYFPISAEDDEKDKTYFSLNYVTGSATDPETTLGLGILEDILLESAASPLKKALIDSNLGKDVFGSYSDEILQPTLSIVIKNSNVESKQAFLDLVTKELTQLIEKGIDQKLIDASINKKEFQLKEADFRGYPTGLIYNMIIMQSWLYDNDPLMHLRYDSLFASIKEKASKGYFEDLIKTYLLNNNHKSLLTLMPQKGLQEANEQKVKDELAAYKKGLSDEQIEQLIKDTENLKKRQMTPDTPEELNSIPKLSLDDVDKKAETFAIEEKEGKVKTFFHPNSSNGIVYFNMMFDTTTIPQEKLPYLSLVARIMGSIGTEKYDYMELSNETNIHLGGMYFSAENYADDKDNKKFYPKMKVGGKAVLDKFPKMTELMDEVINRTNLDDKKRIKDIINETKSRLEMMIMQAGHSLASLRMFSYFSPKAAHDETLRGISYYKFIADLEKNFDAKADEIVANLKEVANLVFCQKDMIVSITGSEDYYEQVKDAKDELIAKFSTADNKKHVYNFAGDVKKEGLFIPGQVQYVAKGANFKDLGFKHDGKMDVMQSIVSLDYMWNNVRVKGGAYGGFANFSNTGNVFFGSYRDPNLSETIEVCNEMDEYLANFEAGEEEMTKYIIGTIASHDGVLTPAMKGERAMGRYICGISNEDIQKDREAILSTKASDINTFAPMVKAAMKEDYICVVGSEQKIKENKELFDNITNILE